MFCKCNPLIIPTNCLCFYPFYQRQFIHFIPSATKLLSPFNKTIHLLKTLEFVWKGKKIVMHYELIALKILFSFNYLTLLFKMPRTSKNNYSFEWSALPSCLTQLNTNAFHGGVIKCKCIVHVQGQVSQVKQCFDKKIGEVWKTSIHHSHRGVIPSYWITFGVYLYPKCT